MVVGHKEREERVKVMVLELMVVLFGGGDGFLEENSKGG